MEKSTTPIPGVAGKKPQTVNQITKQPERIKLEGKPGCGGCLLPTPKPPVKDASKIQPIRGTGGVGGNGKAYAEKTPEKSTVDYSNPRLEKPGKNYKNRNDQFNSNHASPKSQNGERSMNAVFPADSPSVNSLNPGLGKTPVNDNGHVDDKYLSSNRGSQEGGKIPESVQDLMKLFYKFNYTLTYHGHDEVGNRAGEKNGSYFFNGRDGYQRKVNYTANEFGFQPNITLFKLGQGETPEEGTEKELTKLLGNQFIWYY